MYLMYLFLRNFLIYMCPQAFLLYGPELKVK